MQKDTLLQYICRYYASPGSLTEHIISAEVMSFAIESMEYFLETALKVKELIITSLNYRNPVTTSIDKISNKSLLIELSKRYNIKNNQALADALGITRPAISKMLNSKDKDVTE